MVDVVVGDPFVHRREIALVDLLVEPADRALFASADMHRPLGDSILRTVRVIAQLGLLGRPNQVVSASRKPVSVPSPTQAT